MSGNCDRQSEVVSLTAQVRIAQQAEIALRAVTAQQPALADDSALAELLALFAAGALPAADAAQFELLLNDNDPALIELPRTLDSLSPVIDALATQMPTLSPPTQVRTNLLARIASEQTSTHPTIRRSDEADWKEVEPGQFMRVLNIDRRQKRFTALVRLSAGTVYARHYHTASEECYVLEGSLQVGAQRLAAGDYQCSAAGTWHEEQRTDGGCVCLIMAPLDQLLTHRR